VLADFGPLASRAAGDAGPMPACLMTRLQTFCTLPEGVVRGGPRGGPGGPLHILDRSFRASKLKCLAALACLVDGMTTHVKAQGLVLVHAAFRAAMPNSAKPQSQVQKCPTLSSNDDARSR
jgi:hypothetical protein